jgi:hypothetical protein
MMCPVCRKQAKNFTCCGRTFKEEELLAIQASVDFHATAINKEQVKIKPKHGEGQMITSIFSARDRAFRPTQGGWIISRASKYLYVPCVRNALSALGKQQVMF